MIMDSFRFRARNSFVFRQKSLSNSSRDPSHSLNAQPAAGAGSRRGSRTSRDCTDMTETTFDNRPLPSPLLSALMPGREISPAKTDGALLEGDTTAPALLTYPDDLSTTVFYEHPLARHLALTAEEKAVIGLLVPSQLSNRDFYYTYDTDTDDANKPDSPHDHRNRGRGRGGDGKADVDSSSKWSGRRQKKPKNTSTAKKPAAVSSPSEDGRSFTATLLRKMRSIPNLRGEAAARPAPPPSSLPSPILQTPTAIPNQGTGAMLSQGSGARSGASRLRRIRSRGVEQAAAAVAATRASSQQANQQTEPANSPLQFSSPQDEHVPALPKFYQEGESASAPVSPTLPTTPYRQQAPMSIGGDDQFRLAPVRLSHMEYLRQWLVEDTLARREGRECALPRPKLTRYWTHHHDAFLVLPTTPPGIERHPRTTQAPLSAPLSPTLPRTLQQSTTVSAIESGEATQVLPDFRRLTLNLALEPLSQPLLSALRMCGDQTDWNLERDLDDDVNTQSQADNQRQRARSSKSESGSGSGGSGSGSAEASAEGGHESFETARTSLDIDLSLVMTLDPGRAGEILQLPDFSSSLAKDDASSLYSQATVHTAVRCSSSLGRSREGGIETGEVVVSSVLDPHAAANMQEMVCARATADTQAMVDIQALADIQAPADAQAPADDQAPTDDQAPADAQILINTQIFAENTMRTTGASDRQPEAPLDHRLNEMMVQEEKSPHQPQPWSDRERDEHEAAETPKKHPATSRDWPNRHQPCAVAATSGRAGFITTNGSPERLSSAVSDSETDVVPELLSRSNKIIGRRRRLPVLKAIPTGSSVEELELPGLPRPTVPEAAPAALAVGPLPLRVLSKSYRATPLHRRGPSHEVIKGLKSDIDKQLAEWTDPDSTTVTTRQGMKTSRLSTLASTTCPSSPPKCPLPRLPRSRSIGRVEDQAEWDWLSTPSVAGRDESAGSGRGSTSSTSSELFSNLLLRFPAAPTSTPWGEATRSEGRPLARSSIRSRRHLDDLAPVLTRDFSLSRPRAAVDMTSEHHSQGVTPRSVSMGSPRHTSSFFNTDSPVSPADDLTSYLDVPPKMGGDAMSGVVTPSRLSGISSHRESVHHPSVDRVKYDHSARHTRRPLPTPSTEASSTRPSADGQQRTDSLYPNDSASVRHPRVTSLSSQRAELRVWRPFESGCASEGGPPPALCAVRDNRDSKALRVSRDQWFKEQERVRQTARKLVITPGPASKETEAEAEAKADADAPVGRAKQSKHHRVLGFVPFQPGRTPKKFRLL